MNKNTLQYASQTGTSLIAASTPPKTIQVGNETRYLEPRMSANQLAQFVVSDAAKQESIVSAATRVMAVRVANYQPARVAMPQCHTASGIDSTAIIAHATRMRNTVFADPFDEKCNELSAAAFAKFAPIASQIDCAGQRIPTPQRGFAHLLIEGVRVSIQPEIVFSFAHRGSKKFGGVIFNFSKGNQASLENGNGKFQAGDVAAALLFLMLSVHFGASGGPRSANCFAVDVYRESVFPTPGAYKTMLRQIEAACRNIVRQWEPEAALI
jgi:hypothetical protein